MALDSLEDIIRALKEHPEWREPLLDALLPERYRELPERSDRLEQSLERLSQTLERFIVETNQRFQQVAEWQEATERWSAQLTARVDDLTVRLEQLTARVDDLTVRLEQLTRRVDELAARVDDLTVRLEQLTARVDDLTVRLEQLTARVDDLTVRLEQLTARVDELTKRVDELTERVNQLTARMDALVERVGKMQDDLGELKGISLEGYYCHNATAILGYYFRKLKVEDKGRLIEALHDERPLSKEEWQELVAIDLLVSGHHRRTEEEYLMVWEISWTVDESDVQRALQRAELLRQRGFNTLPVVAGRGITGTARTRAEASKVLAVMGSAPLDGTGLVG